MIWRLLRSLLLLFAGAVAGFAGAAAMLRGWLPSHGDETSDDLALVTILDGVELKSRSAAFGGGRILAWFGGVSLDLTDATLAPGASLDVRAAFGGIAVKVPRGWRVEATAMAIAGGVDTSVTEPEAADAPLLTVRATCFMGGVSIGH